MATKTRSYSAPALANIWNDESRISGKLEIIRYKLSVGKNVYNFSLSHTEVVVLVGWNYCLLFIIFALLQTIFLH